MRRNELSNEMETEENFDYENDLPHAMSSLSLEESSEEEAPVKKKAKPNPHAKLNQPLAENSSQNFSFPVQKTRPPVANTRKSIASANAHGRTQPVPKAVVAKRSLTVPQSPKLLTKRLR
jgi:hypothetical protein